MPPTPPKTTCVPALDPMEELMKASALYERYESITKLSRLPEGEWYARPSSAQPVGLILRPTAK